MRQAKQKTFRTTLVVTGIIIASKLLGFVREMVMAAYFGRGIESDAYVTAYGILSLFTLLFTAGISSTFYSDLYTAAAAQRRQRRQPVCKQRVIALLRGGLADQCGGLLGGALAGGAGIPGFGGGRGACNGAFAVDVPDDCVLGDDGRVVQCAQRQRKVYSRTATGVCAQRVFDYGMRSIQGNSCSGDCGCGDGGDSVSDSAAVFAR